MNELALFAGAGGGILGGHLLGWRTICAVEWDAYAASILVHRQNDGSLPPFPIWDDVQTFDGRPWRGRVDVISGGFPCQDISAAGKGAGIDGERSGMWGHMARIVGEVRPRFVFVENSPMLVGRGLARVLGDLASLGYDAKWGVLGARNAGAPHKRDRIWIVGELPDSQLLRRNSRLRGQAGQQPGERREARGVIASSGEDVADSDLCRFVEPIDDEKRRDGVDSRESPGNCCRASEDVADAHGSGSESFKPSELRAEGAFQSPGHSGEADQTQGEEESQGEEAVPHAHGKRPLPPEGHRELGGQRSGECGHQERGGGGQDAAEVWWATEPELGRVAYGVAHRVDRLKCIGNGQVPQCAALAWRILTTDE